MSVLVRALERRGHRVAIVPVLDARATVPRAGLKFVTIAREFLLGVMALVCLPLAVRADLGLTFNVVLETDTPANTVPRSNVARPTREFALTVVLGDDYVTSVGDHTTSLIDFAGRKIYHLIPPHQLYLTFSLYSVLGFREAELRNRLMMRRALAAGGHKDNPFDTILTEHLFSLRAPDAPPLTTTGPADALAYSQDGKPLFACSAAGAPVSATEAKHFGRFLRYAYAMHPDILKALEERRRIPAEFDLRHYNMKTEHYRFRLVNAEPVARGWEPDKAMAGMKLRESEVDPLCVLAHAISQQEFAQRCAGLVQAAVKASEARRYLDSLLLFLEYTISSGQPLPKEWGAHVEKIRNDPEARGFLGALQPRGKEAAQKAAEAMRLLQAQTQEGLPVLKVHEANFLTAAGKPEEAQRLFREVLQQSPAMVGAWKDLGDLYYRSYQMELAWQCWDAGRRLHPDHKQFKPVGELERRLVVEHPEYFEAELARPARIDGIPAPPSPRGPVTPEKAAVTPAPARGPANSTAKAPTTAAGYNSRGISKQLKGDFGGAIRDHDQAVRIDPTYAVTWINRANARHAQGDFETALSDYDRGIALAKDHAPYARLFRCLIQRRMKRGDADAELSRDVVKWTFPWTKAVARFLTGQMTEADLHAAAARGAGQTTPWLPCEAYYFAGMQALLSGEVERARGLLEKCVDTNKASRTAFMLARAELARLPPPAR
jgi:tetratricopeptide (TPR) repeat protein